MPYKDDRRVGVDVNASVDLEPFDAIVPAGGRSARMGGIDKCMIKIGEQTMLDRVALAVEDAQTIVVVGPSRPISTSRDIIWAREEPPGGGPLAAVDAGIAFGSAPNVVVVAADLPFAASGIAVLRRALNDNPAADGAVLQDRAAIRQPLLSIFRRDPLARHLAAIGPVAGLPARNLLGVGQQVIAVQLAGDASLDCDDWEAVSSARKREGVFND